jgi:hypothetical protein
MAAKKGGSDPAKAPLRAVPTAMPALEVPSPFLGPDPSPTEEVLFDLSQHTAGRAYESIDQLNNDLKLFTSAGAVQPSKPLEPRARAQRLVYDAWRANGQAGIALAKQALTIDADCADAHLFLAATSDDPEQVLQGAFRAVEAGERSVGEGEEAADEGRLWSYLPARPYLRARAFLARGLWAMGARLAAVEMARESLELDRDDALGQRHLLLAWYLEMGEMMFTRNLLEDYKKDNSAVFLFGDALLTYWEDGPGRSANTLLQRAMKANGRVAERLLDDPPDPEHVMAIDTYQFGSEEEADLCAFLLEPAWYRDEDALEWLEEVHEKNERAADKKPTTPPPARAVPSAPPSPRGGPRRPRA